MAFLEAISLGAARHPVSLLLLVAAVAVLTGFVVYKDWTGRKNGHFTDSDQTD